ncbi:MAG: sugar phosphate isomerase/epimerase family protein [Promethearchaeota archaeon]
MQKYLACRIGSYGSYILHSYEHLHEIGVNFIERQLPSGDDEAEMLEDILEEFSLKVSSFQGHFDPLNQKAFKKQVETTISMAKRFGTTIIFASIKAPEKEKKKLKLFEKLRELGDAFKENDLKLCMETHPNLVTNGKVGRETMEQINHENVRINFDTANMYYYNKGIDAVKELDLIAEFVGSVHLKDSNGKVKSWYFPTLGEGIVDFPAIVKKLSSIGFKGPYTMELEGIEGQKLDLDQTKEMVKKSAEYILNYL